MEKISVIVPVYNAEKYIEQCVKSILSQSYQNLELVLINDGSTDQSPAILERLGELDDRIRVFHKENGGEGTTRNLGVSVALGDYLIFVDADDWIDHNHIERLHEVLLRTESDIAVTNFTPFIEETGVYQIHLSPEDYYEEVHSPQEWFQMQYGKGHHLSQCFTVPWVKLYKKSLFETVRYPEHVKHAADDYTTWKLYLLADKIVYINEASYVYRENASSLTQTGDSAQVFSFKPVEERLTTLSSIGFDVSNEVAAYEWRLRIHRQQFLKTGDMFAYNDANFKLKLLEKYKNND